MPKLACPCGYIHDLSPIPDDGWVTVRNRDYESLIDATRSASDGDRAGRASWIGLVGLLYECPECGRLMWQPPGRNRFSVFTPSRLPGDPGRFDP